MKTKPEVENLQMDPEEALKDVETFNPLWHNDEFWGPNTMRYKNADEERDGE